MNGSTASVYMYIQVWERYIVLSKVLPTMYDLDFFFLLAYNIPLRLLVAFPIVVARTGRERKKKKREEKKKRSLVPQRTRYPGIRWYEFIILRICDNDKSFEKEKRREGKEKGGESKGNLGGSLVPCVHRVRIYSNRVLGMKIRFEVAECIRCWNVFPFDNERSKRIVKWGRRGRWEKRADKVGIDSRRT